MNFEFCAQISIFTQAKKNKHSSVARARKLLTITNSPRATPRALCESQVTSLGEGNVFIRRFPPTQKLFPPNLTLCGSSFFPLLPRP